MTYTRDHTNSGSLAHCDARDQTSVFRDTSKIHFHGSMMGTPKVIIDTHVFIALLLIVLGLFLLGFFFPSSHSFFLWFDVYLCLDCFSLFVCVCFVDFVL